MLMDLEAYETADESTYSSNIENASNTGEQAKATESEFGDFLDPNLTLACQTKAADSFSLHPRPLTLMRSRREESDFYNIPTDSNYNQCKNSHEELYHINYDTVSKLKESTKKLLCVLEEIQSKTHSKNFNSDETCTNLSKLLKPVPPTKPNDLKLPSVTDIVGANALKRLEDQTKHLDSIYIEEEEDDCSVYSRLTRKCHCLNHNDYNDLIIHFNEDTKYRTSKTGEIIKNLRILKKFLYINGGYTKNALLFLNEGLSESSHTERVEITQGCAHADLCNVFDEHSIVVTYISWPCKSDYCGDYMTQALTAGFLYKLAQLEEGRRYLNFTSKICNDIRKVIRKKASLLEFETLESLNTTLNLLLPPTMAQNVNVTYYSKPIDEGSGKKTVQNLQQFLQCMTLGEIFTHLELLCNVSTGESGKFELMSCLPSMLMLFKRLLLAFDNSEMNILITNILNNVVSKNVTKGKEFNLPTTSIIAETATEPILMKTQTCQIPIKINTKKNNKSKSALGVSPHKFRNLSRRKVSERQTSPVINLEPPRLINRSRKFNKDARNSVIVVPMEKKETISDKIAHL